MSAPSAPFDRGLQPERSALAWHRTALALIVGPLVVARLLAVELGGWAVVFAVVGLGLGLLVLAVAARRYRQVHEVLTGRPAPRRTLLGLGPERHDRPREALATRLPGGRLLLATALLPTAGGLVILVTTLRGR